MPNIIAFIIIRARYSEVFTRLSISYPQLNLMRREWLHKQARENIKKYVDERLPEKYEKCLVGLNSILREAWDVSQATASRIEKIKALTLAKECYVMKLDLLTNATVVGDAIRFVSSHVVAAATEKDNTDDRVIEDEEISDVQRSEKGHSRQQSTTRTAPPTNNTIF
jgi:hypothetical protein